MRRLAQARASATPQTSEQRLRRGFKHHQSGEFGEAELIYREVRAAEPDNFDAVNLLGVIAAQQRNHADAEGYFLEALRICPSSSAVLNNLAGTYKDRGQLDQAEVYYRNALESDPGAVASWLNLGSVLQRRGALDQAEDCYRHALEVQANSSDACNGIGAVFQTRGMLLEAQVWFRRALEANPDSTDAASNLAGVLEGLGQLDEAEALCRLVLGHLPNHSEALNTLGTILKRIDRLSEAESCYQRVLAVAPDHAAAWTNLGTIASTRGDLDTAEACFRKSTGLDSNSAAAKYNLATLMLLRGRYAEGFALYEHRFAAFSRDPGSSRCLSQSFPSETRWQVQDLRGFRILVWAEQGLGDSLMMMRYLPELKTRGARKILVYCDQALHRLVRTLPDVDAVLPDCVMPSLTDFDFHCPLMSLPLLLQCGAVLQSVEVPYLIPDGSLVAQWRDRLRSGRDRILRVGLAWAGNPSLRDDARRSIPLDYFASLACIDRVRFFSLQKGDAAKQLQHWNECEVFDYMGQCDDLMDTAALIANLDIVISVDTAVAHLAGAMAKPVWLLNRYGSEWRWGLDREDSPWYPTMRIFRQQSPGDWSPVIARVAVELRSVH